MKLQLNIFKIINIKKSSQTKIADKVLYLNISELKKKLLIDKRLADVHIELARPGEKCRIANVRDVIEPRAKINENSVNYPGVLGKQSIAGEGTSIVLSGTAVVVCAGVKRQKRDPNGEYIDMSGPASDLSPFGKTHNIVVTTYPAEGLNINHYMKAIKVAGLKASVYLANAGIDLPPDVIKHHELTHIQKSSEAISDLPRVAYVCQLLATQFDHSPDDPILYGTGIDKMIPTVMHPNEVIDGAVIAPFNRDGSTGITTYSLQNNPVILDLYKRHGRELNFTGVILTISSVDNIENERSATMSASIAKGILKADGVVMTKSGGGAPEIAMALIGQACERVGVKTCLALWQIAPDPKTGTFTVFNMKELDAIVSMGMPREIIRLPQMKKAITTKLSCEEKATITSERDCPLWDIAGARDEMGSGNLKMVVF